MLAYLVIREGAKWTDVFRLIPGQTVTVGRAPTNQIVIKDDRCSRYHAEIFMSDGAWMVRDLDSRNGTQIDTHGLKGDHELVPGDVIRIGKSQLAFVHDLSKAFPDSSSLIVKEFREDILPEGEETEVLTAPEPTTITHRTGQTRLLEFQDEDANSGVSAIGVASAKLCKLAFELAQALDQGALAKTALDGLLDSVKVASGAVLLLPRDFVKTPTSDDLEVIVSRAAEGKNYTRVTPFLATTVLREHEAVLARNVLDDSNVVTRDSEGHLDATSVICAPVRRGNRMYGLVHLYSTDSTRDLDPDDLEFTLAVADTLAVALQNLSRREELAENLTRIRDENRQLRQRLGVQSEIIGKSLTVARITEQIARAAPTNATVLIRGESGVGKELVARAIHFSSTRNKGPFVCLNCAALSESLLESEMFGHERGAFTGAVERKIGKFEAADQGTLMLDEIGEMSPTIQAKFLRVLEGHSFERVGGSEPVKVDARVIAATNRDLERDVSEGRFRQDLYFRLHVLEILVPALRRRPEDIPELAHYYLERLCAETGRKIKGFSPGALDQLVRYRWPGNVRELKNVIERAVVLARADVIDHSDLMLSNLAPSGESAGEGPGYSAMSLAEIEAKHIAATLQSTGWNKSQAATILGIERSTLDRKIRRYEISENPPPRKKS